MKIIIFTENNHCGGMDTFYPTLINQWPYPDDEFVFICNESHPGLDNIKRSITKNCEIIGHSMPLNWTLSRKLFGWLPYILRRASQPFLRMLLVPVQMRSLRKMFETTGGDRLLVVNGGYPGGESCRLANIVWHKMGRLTSVHNIRNFAIQPRFGFTWYEKILDDKLINSVSHFVGVSKVCAASLYCRDKFKKNEHIQHIYNGLDVNEEDYESNLNLKELFHIPENAPTCIMLATYELRKGYELLFNAIELVRLKVPDAHFLICGDGTLDEIETVKKLRNAISPESNIHFHGFIAGARSLIKQSEILLIPSQEFESFGWTAIEGMLAKVPVVSTDVGGLPEVIGEDGNCGFCIPKDDYVSYAKKIIQLLSSKPLRTKLGANGFERVHEFFSSERMVLEYSQLIKSAKSR